MSKKLAQSLTRYEKLKREALERATRLSELFGWPIDSNEFKEEYNDILLSLQEKAQERNA